MLGNVIAVGTQSVDSMAIAEDKAIEHAGRMGGVWRDKEIQIE